MPPMLAVRADGGPTLGSGHLARTFALVERWVSQGGAAVLVSHDPPEAWVRRFAAVGCEVRDPSAARPPADWWVVDGYHLTGDDRRAEGMRVLLVDDHDTAGTGGAGADLVLDQNLGADASAYPGAPAALVGPRYALVRREILDVATERGPVVERPLRRLLLSFGGAPSPEVQALVATVTADPRLAGLHVQVLAGADDVVGPLLGADAAVVAAGSTTWELACCGIPAVLVPVAPNQEPLAERVSALGAALRSEPEQEAIVAAVLELVAAPALASKMAEAGRRLVDGAGAARVATRLRSGLVSLRPGTAADAGDLHRWRNDPATRAGSFSSDEVAWDDHVAWLDRRLADADADLLVATDEAGRALGVVRFDPTPSEAAEIGVTVAPDRRGEGWGAALVDAGCRWLAGTRGRRRVIARIRPDNPASVRAFVAADFDARPPEADGSLLYDRSLDGS